MSSGAIGIYEAERGDQGGTGLLSWAKSRMFMGVVMLASGSATWVQGQVFSTCLLHDYRQVTEILFHKRGT